MGLSMPNQTSEKALLEPMKAGFSTHPPLRVMIDLSGHGQYYRLELERLLEAMSATPSREALLEDRRESADCVLRIEGCPQLRGSVMDCYRRSSASNPREFVWDSGDLPTGGLAGFYVSLPSYMYDGRRHRAFCLPIRCNEAIRHFDTRDATHIFGFFGAISSGLRGRMVPILNSVAKPGEALIEVRDSIWHQMFDRSGLPAKLEYAENLRRCRFNLCPRGNVLAGTGSRLYETLQAGRVPVIISDWMTLPAGIDWQCCSVRVRESDIARIPEILDHHMDRWYQMAASARRIWEMHFSEPAMLGELGRQLRDLLKWEGEGQIGPKLSGTARISLGLVSWKSRQLYSAIQRWRRRRGRQA